MKTLKLIKNFSLLLTICLISTTASSQPELNAAKVERNVVFGMFSGLALLMDIYYPENPNGYAVIHISGSGWTKPLSYDARLLNHQGHVKIEGEALVEAGYTLFSINHRAVPRFKYPAAVEDAQRAVRFIRFHADKYNIDPDRIAAVGGSSGGHLVSMLGVLDGDESSGDDTPINQVSAKVQCVIARAAPTDFMNGGVGEHFIDVRGKPREENSIEFKRAMEASPVTHITADDPPFLLVHGDQDNIVPYELSVNMKNKLDAVGIPVKLITVEEARHGPSYPGATKMPDLKAAYVDWLNTHLMTWK